MQDKITSWPTRLASYLTSVSMFMANMCLSGMLILVFSNVMLRYVFKRPIHWGDEIMTYLMILVAFLGFGYNLFNNRHVRMTALVERLSSKAKNIVRLITSIIALVYFSFLMFAGIKLAMGSFETGYFSEDTGLPIGPWQVLMCIGIGVLLIATIVYVLNMIKIVAGRQKE